MTEANSLQNLQFVMNFLRKVFLRPIIPGAFIWFQYQNITIRFPMSQKQLTNKSMQYTRKKIESYSYGLNDEIGKGYSSKVYRGRHDDTNENVAVKVIDLKMLKNEINRTLLDSEIQILKELKNIPNILSLHDVFTTKNNTYIITELCESDLSKHIKKQLTEPEVFEYMNQLVKGYAEFQKREIVHRDLKPANLLITDRNMLKIADFGFGIKTDQLLKSSKYNVGSPLYMAPESLKKNQYSFKTDIWSIGVIFYEMLTNDTPWRAKNQKELLRKIESEPIHTILSSKNLSNIAKQFLNQTLKLDKHARMSPEQLQIFSFNPCKGNILMQKIVNNSLRPCLKNDSISVNSPSYGYMKNNTEKSLDKHMFLKNSKSKHGNLEGNESIQFKNTENTKNSITSPQTFRKSKPEEKTVRNQAINKQNKKLISKILISLVHFCRFLFKLIQKMKESTKTGILREVNPDEVQNIFKNYAGVIKHKVDNLNNFKNYNFIKCEGYKEYKQTSDYEKLMKISKEYNERYRSQVHKYWNQPYFLSPEPTNRMIISLYEALKTAVTKMNNPQEEIAMLSKDVVILDYLITSRQLIEMIKNNPDGYERFARKSRIDEIVEGKTVDIHLELYHQIMHRVKQIMEKSQFVSFGGNLMNEDNMVMA